MFEIRDAEGVVIIIIMIVGNAEDARWISSMMVVISSMRAVFVCNGHDDNNVYASSASPICSNGTFELLRIVTIAVIITVIILIFSLVLFP